MHNSEELAPLIQPFEDDDRETLYSQAKKYDELLRDLLDNARTTKDNSEKTNGILALIWSFRSWAKLRS